MSKTWGKHYLQKVGEQTRLKLEIYDAVFLFLIKESFTKKNKSVPLIHDVTWYRAGINRALPKKEYRDIIIKYRTDCDDNCQLKISEGIIPNIYKRVKREKRINSLFK